MIKKSRENWSLVTVVYLTHTKYVTPKVPIPFVSGYIETNEYTGLSVFLGLLDK